MAIESLIEIAIKLLALNIIPNLSAVKSRLLTSEKRIQLYEACNGKLSMPELQKKAGASSTMVETNLPLWEKEGLLISVGHGGDKRYLALEHLSSYLQSLNE